jgi:hypothetical protein
MLIRLDSYPEGRLCALFELGEQRRTRIELEIRITSQDWDAERPLAQVARIIENSSYWPTPNACSECNWYEMVTLIKRCHDEAMRLGRHVSTTLRIDDEEAAHAERRKLGAAAH